jgi:chitinase
MAASLVSQSYSQVSGIKGLMTWSINWDGSLGYTFANTKPF